MASYYDKLLKHPDVRQRKRNIAALAKEGDTGALYTLRELSVHDPDPEVRELADKAYLYIKSNAGAISEAKAEALAQQKATDLRDEKPKHEYILEGYTATGGKPRVKKTVVSWRQQLGLETVESERSGWVRLLRQVQAEGAADPKALAFDISAKDRQRAVGYVKRGMEYQASGDYATSANYLLAAIDYNPNLIEDSRMVNLLSSAFGIPPEQVIGEIINQYQQEMGAGKRGSGRLINWKESRFFVLELVVLYIALALMLTLAFLLNINTIEDELQTLRTQATLTATERSILTAFENHTTWNATTTWVSSGFIYAGFVMASGVLAGIITWMAAPMFADSSIDLFFFLRTMLRVTVGTLFVAGVFWAITNELFAPGDAAGLIFAALPILAGVVAAAAIIGRGRENGLFKGFAQMATGTVLFFVCAWWLVFLFGLLPDEVNPAVQALPQDPLPYYEAVEYEQGETSTYSYPWNLLPLPPGLPLPEQPLEELLFGNQ